MGGRVQTRLEKHRVKRQQETKEQRETHGESRVQTKRDRDRVKRQQETSEQRESRAQTRRERTGLFLPLDDLFLA